MPPILDLSSYKTSRTSKLFEFIRQQQENKKSAHITEMSVTFILISFFFFFAIRPAVVTLISLITEIKSKQVLSVQLKNRINSTLEAQDKFSEFQKNYLILEQTLPSKPNYTHAGAQVVGTVLSMGKPRPNLTFPGIKDNNKQIDQKPGQAPSFTLSLSLPLTYNETQLFLQKLYQLRRVLQVNSVSIAIPSSQAKDSTQSAQPSSSFQVKMFYAN